MQTADGPSTRTKRGGREKLPAASSAEIIITVPDLSVNDWTSLDVEVQTGLAAIAAPVEVVPPDYLKSTLRCDGHVRDQDRVRIRVQNIGPRTFAETEFPIHLQPAAKRRSLFPEIKIDLSEVRI